MKYDETSTLHLPVPFHSKVGKILKAGVLTSILASCGNGVYWGDPLTLTEEHQTNITASCTYLDFSSGHALTECKRNLYQELRQQEEKKRERVHTVVGTIAEAPVAAVSGVVHELGSALAYGLRMKMSSGVPVFDQVPEILPEEAPIPVPSPVSTSDAAVITARR